MPYTLWSTEGLLGESELDFVWRDDRRRAGFLDPTELGEILLGIAPGTPIETPPPDMSLTLELRDENGVVIPTEDIFVRDIDYVMSLVDDAHDEPRLSPEQEAEIERSVEHDLALFFASDEPDEPDEPDDETAWRSPNQPPASRWTRFQIHVRLIDDASIP